MGPPVYMATALLTQPPPKPSTPFHGLDKLFISLTLFIKSDFMNDPDIMTMKGDDTFESIYKI